MVPKTQTANWWPQATSSLQIDFSRTYAVLENECQFVSQ